MARRILLLIGWFFPLCVALLFVLKGRRYDPAVFTPPASEVSSLPLPVAVNEWVLEDGLVLPADRMYEKINGKADYYLQYGADELCSGEWVAGDQRWDMYLYRFKTEQGAGGAYNGERSADGIPIESIQGYTVPGQAALAIGRYYLQLNALTADADPDPAVKLALALVPYLSETTEGTGAKADIDLVALAGEDMSGDAEGFVPENAFGFSVFNKVRTVEVALDGATAVWFTTDGDAGLVSAFAEELAMYGGEELFTENGASGGSMFGSWGMAGVLDGAVWGVQNAPSKEVLLQHWNALQERLGTASEEP